MQVWLMPLVSSASYFIIRISLPLVSPKCDQQIFLLYFFSIRTRFHYLKPGRKLDLQRTLQRLYCSCNWTLLTDKRITLKTKVIMNGEKMKTEQKNGISAEKVLIKNKNKNPATFQRLLNRSRNCREKVRVKGDGGRGRRL